MAEILSSAVVGEAVNKILSSLISKDEEKSNATENIERLEMAHIKMESALHIAGKWQITDVPLLRWRNKLKRAAQECDDALRRCKKRALEEEEIRQLVSQSSFPKRIAHATKSFISSFIGSNIDESSSGSANVWRFERFAEGANEFLKFIEFGGTPRKNMFFNPIIGHLLSGKSMRYQTVRGSKLCYLGIRPMSFAERGVEAMIAFVFQDLKELTKGFCVGFMMRLSESTDVFGVIIKCMQSVTPHFKFAAEGVKRELIKLPTQDFSWLPYSLYSKNEYWDNIHNILTQWYRPNPLCCYENKHNLITSSSTDNTVAVSSRVVPSIFPEEVIVVLLQCHVSLSYQHKSRPSSAAEHGGNNSLNSKFPPMKLGVLIIPHDSPEAIEPAAESYALEVIDEKEQGMIHTNACLQDLDEKLLPKAMDYLYQNSESKTYQMCLKSRHGTAHLCVEKTSAQMQRGHRSKTKTTRQAWNKRVIIRQRRHDSVELWKQLSRDFLKLWVVRASDTLQGLFRSWTGST